MKPRLLLVGADQIEPGEWRTAECTGIYDPWGFVPTDSEIPLLSEPEFDPRRYDGVVFCIPNYKKTPAQLIADALQAGLPVLAVKMRLDGLSGLAPVRELPRELRDRFWIGEHYRFQPGALAVRTAVAEGRIGRVEYVSMRCTLPMPQRSPWMDAYRHLILEDLAYHHMTVIEGICGGLVGSVFAQSWQPSWMVDRGYAAFLLHADSGWRMLYETRWGSAEPGSNFFGEIVAEGALGRFGQTEAKQF